MERYRNDIRYEKRNYDDAVNTASFLKERSKIIKEIREKYMQDLLAASWWKKLKLQLKIQKEINNRLERLAPPN